MATRRNTHQRARAASVKGQLERIESVSFSAALRTRYLDSLPQNRSSSSSHRSLPVSNVRPALAPANIWVTEHILRPFDTPNSTPPRSPTTHKPREEEGFWSDLRTLRWVVRPCTRFLLRPLAHMLTFHVASSFKIIASVIVLYINWEIITPHVAPGTPNPFAPLIFISHRVESSFPGEPRYAKGYMDLVFVASYVVFFSFLRQIFTLHIFQSFARWYGIKKSKFDRFGEQGYAFVYWGGMSVWGYVSSLNT